MYRNEQGLFYALEIILKAAKEPLTCVQMYNDNFSVREHANNPNRVSDYLGGLWRKGLVTRVPAPKTNNSSARWAYAWKTEQVHTKISEHIEYHAGAKKFVDGIKQKSIHGKPGIEITEDDNSVTIELENFTITVRRK